MPQNENPTLEQIKQNINDWLEDIAKKKYR